MFVFKQTSQFIRQSVHCTETSNRLKLIFLGNKSDCGTERVVKREDGERLAQEYKVPFMETSAKTGLNVELAFLAVARYFHRSSFSTNKEKQGK